MAARTGWRPSRREAFGGLALLASGASLLAANSCSAQSFPTSSETFAFDVVLDGDAAGAPVNRRVLGSNVGWAFGGDDMLDKTGEFDPGMLRLARQIGPTVLRYPGGTYADVFRWEAARNEHVFNRQQQSTLMDTQRFLELCEALDAQPLITVNIVTGTPEEAVRWIAATNIRGMTSRLTGRPLPRVAFWELGNEPYLQEDSRHDIDLAPEEFARRANRFIAALRKVDADISIGLPLTNDRRAGVAVTPYPGFARKVLAIVTERFDYVSLHDAYMPFGGKTGMDRRTLYWAAAAAARTVRKDIEAMTALLAELRPGQTLPVAITEYAPLFSLGKGATDALLASPAGAIYMADLLRVFARTPEVLLANHWSLSANWLFGAIHADGHARPAGEVLRLMGEALRGERLEAQVRSPTQRVEKVGQVEPLDAMPLIETLVTRDGPTLRIVFINKDPARAANGRVDMRGAQLPATAALALLTARDLFDASDVRNVFVRTDSTVDLAGKHFFLPLPPHSVALLTIDCPLS